MTPKGCFLLVALSLTAPVPADAWQVEQPANAGVVVAGDGDVVSSGYLLVGIVPTSLLARLRASDGKVRWTASEPGYGFSVVALDAAGDVIAAGTGPSTGSTPGRGALVVAKHDGESGVQAWRYELAGDVLSQFGARALALDPGGDALVVGDTIGLESRYTVVRLDGASGAEEWRFTLPNRVSCEAAANDVALDAAGDVLVTGTSSDGSGEDAPCAAITVKLAGETGDELWRDVDDGLGTAIAVDDDGDVVSGGRCHVVELAAEDGAERWRWDDTVTCTGSDGHVLDLGVLNDDVVVVKRVRPDAVRPGVVRLDGTTGAVEWGWPTLFEPVEPFEPLVPRDTLGITSGGDVVVGGFPAMVVVAGESGLLRASYEDRTIGVAIGADGSIAVADNPLQKSRFVPRLTRFLDRLPGAVLKLQDRATDPAKRRLTWTAKDKLTLAPSKLYDADPTAVGATLEVRNPSTGETATMVLPAAGWTYKPTAKGPVYGYVDGSGALGPCRSAKIVSGKGVQASCAGAGIGFTLDEPAQGALAVQLTVGSNGARWCTFFGGVVARDVPASGAVVGYFQALRAPAPPACPIP